MHWLELPTLNTERTWVRTLFFQAASAHHALEEQEHVPTCVSLVAGRTSQVVTVNLTFNLIVIYVNLYLLICTLLFFYFDLLKIRNMEGCLKCKK